MSNLTHFKDLFDPVKILNYICRNNLRKTFPNVTVALCILLTLPMTVASKERSFSKLKLITYLRFTISQEHLDGLALLAIEGTVLDDCNRNSPVEDSAKRKVKYISDSKYSQMTCNSIVWCWISIKFMCVFNFRARAYTLCYESTAYKMHHPLEKAKLLNVKKPVQLFIKNHTVGTFFSYRNYNKCKSV